MAVVVRHNDTRFLLFVSVCGALRGEVAGRRKLKEWHDDLCSDFRSWLSWRCLAGSLWLRRCPDWFVDRKDSHR